MKDVLRYCLIVALTVLCVYWIIKSGLHNNEIVYFSR
jgi:hypothetical protein